ncbi:hypothetical protein P4310_31100 [Bacillus thuringiensis]|nr:hypothetical protein [Bacillus thuringiensis]MED3069835.1 hypothetical protein [Bacillus thuringiensis]OUB26319.1 hypothetical protein BK737_25935 [Bacillus thuringiensis serovar palmanyolensis]OUB30743.1 hypothetical protein BK737_17145 [Bacillus thuringiensis serovar palmanyolensis]OUB30766.1 hypothetical protein BK737_17000 [Bacillus thuringiensis serovar palmanyolensis]OUB34512.1 hypothetical protein BK737_07910 [Bacillus thuringiensis serovar palmanyolensis]
MKRKSILLVPLLLFTLFPSFTPTSATTNSCGKASSPDEIKYQSDEISNMDVLFERAIKDVNEDPDVPKATVSLQKDNENVSTDSIKTFTTTQKLKEFVMNDENITTYKATSFTIIPKKTLGIEGGATEETNNPIDILNSLGQTKEGYDGSYSVIASNTTYYDYISCDTGGGPVGMYKITQVSGSWRILDSQVRLGTGYVGWSVSTTGYSSACVHQTPYQAGSYTNKGTISPGSTYTIYPSQKYYGVSMSHFYIVGQQKVTIIRGGSSYTFELQNRL